MKFRKNYFHSGKNMYVIDRKAFRTTFNQTIDLVIPSGKHVAVTKLEILDFIIISNISII